MIIPTNSLKGTLYHPTHNQYGLWRWNDGLSNNSIIRFERIETMVFPPFAFGKYPSQLSVSDYDWLATNPRLVIIYHVVSIDGKTGIKLEELDGTFPLEDDLVRQIGEYDMTDVIKVDSWSPDH